MTNTILKQTLFLSLLGHLTIFSIFSFSFGNKPSRQEFAQVVFWGAILRSSDLNQTCAQGTRIARMSNTPLLDRRNREYPLISNYYLTPLRNTKAIRVENKISNGVKPVVNLTFNQDKMIPVQKLALVSLFQRRKEPIIMFYPHLPNHFLLYFKDRQVVHIELMFNIVARGSTNSIAIKRKISSGNLEADLLSMRYIGHYLFIQQTALSPNKWQTVKIDLSAKND